MVIKRVLPLALPFIAFLLKSAKTNLLEAFSHKGCSADSEKKNPIPELLIQDFVVHARAGLGGVV